jgi:hypothetical protein
MSIFEPRTIKLARQSDTFYVLRESVQMETSTFGALRIWIMVVTLRNTRFHDPHFFVTPTGCNLIAYDSR